MAKSNESKSRNWGGKRENQTGRPKGSGKPVEEKAVKVNTSFTVDIYQPLADEAERLNTTVSSVIRDIVRQYFNK